MLCRKWNLLQDHVEAKLTLRKEWKRTYMWRNPYRRPIWKLWKNSITPLRLFERAATTATKVQTEADGSEYMSMLKNKMSDRRDPHCGQAKKKLWADRVTRAPSWRKYSFATKDAFSTSKRQYRVGWLSLSAIQTIWPLAYQLLCLLYHRCSAWGVDQQDIMPVSLCKQ